MRKSKTTQADAFYAVRTSERALALCSLGKVFVPKVKYLDSSLSVVDVIKLILEENWKF